VTRRQRLIGVLLLSVLAHVAVLAILPADGRLVEAVYAQQVYPRLGPVVAFVPSLLPFSLAGLLLPALLIGLPAYAAVNVVRWRRGALGGRQAAERTLLAWFAAGAAVLHTFYIFWGYNYLRPPLEQRLGLAGIEFAPAERLEFARRFVGAAAAARVAIEDWDRRELDTLVDAAIAQALMTLEARPTPVVSPLKGDLGSGLLALTGTRGFVFGCTLEAHVDFRLPAFQLPFTAAHEKAHLAGFARERDANFVAWLALTRAQDPRLRYAGYFGVVTYFLNGETRELAGPVLDDRAELARYAAATVSLPVRGAGQRVYGTYLRANRMPAGTSDYAQVWQLIQAWERSRER